VLGLSLLSISPIYLVAVLLCATTVGRWPAMLCAGLSFVAFKFFFVAPIYSFTVDDAEDLSRLLIFLATAFLAGGMASRVREQATAAQQRADEAAALYELSQAISTQLDFNSIAPLIVATTMRLLDSPGCRLLLMSPEGMLNDCAQSGHWPADAVAIEASLRSSGQTLGVLQVVSAPTLLVLAADQQRLLDTLANQAALALERSRLAQAAAQAEALAASDRLKSTLLSTVSHDFRTPLGAIIAATDELIAEDIAWSPAASRDFARVIQAQAQRLNHLVTNLLDLTRIEAGVLHPQRGWYNVAEIIYTVIERLSSDLAGRSLELVIPDELPLIPVDYVQLEQVVWNILQNALNYSPSDSPITIAVAVQDSALLIHLGDRGPGIAPEQRTQVFEKFYRLPQANGEHIPGTGIGLAICKGLIEAHRGRIAIHGREGGGTLVEIALPMQETETPVLVGA
jgi:two-component system, OmpR family, sensor histidine kinase KdpD